MAPYCRNTENIAAVGLATPAIETVPTHSAGLPNGWRVGDKTGNNGKDVAGDIAMTWSTRGEPVLICAYTQGGAPTPGQVEAVLACIGCVVGMHLSSAV